MSSILLSCSNGVVIATAMVFSSTALFLAFSRQFSANQNSKTQNQTILRRPILRSPSPAKKFLTLSNFSSETEEKSKQSKNTKKKKKKKVKFAENVKEPKGNGEEYRKREQLNRRIKPELVTKPEKKISVSGNYMPANRIALYNGILRDRDHRIHCSY